MVVIAGHRCQRGAGSQEHLQQRVVVRAAGVEGHQARGGRNVGVEHVRRVRSRLAGVAQVAPRAAETALHAAGRDRHGRGARVVGLREFPGKIKPAGLPGKAGDADEVGLTGRHWRVHERPAHRAGAHRRILVARDLDQPAARPAVHRQNGIEVRLAGIQSEHAGAARDVAIPDVRARAQGRARRDGVTTGTADCGRHAAARREIRRVRAEVVGRRSHVDVEREQPGGRGLSGDPDVVRLFRDCVERQSARRPGARPAGGRVVVAQQRRERAARAAMDAQHRIEGRAAGVDVQGAAAGGCVDKPDVAEARAAGARAAVGVGPAVVSGECPLADGNRVRARVVERRGRVPGGDDQPIHLRPPPTPTRPADADVEPSARVVREIDRRRRTAQVRSRARLDEPRAVGAVDRDAQQALRDAVRRALRAAAVIDDLRAVQIARAHRRDADAQRRGDRQVIDVPVDIGPCDRDERGVGHRRAADGAHGVRRAGRDRPLHPRRRDGVVGLVGVAVERVGRSHVVVLRAPEGRAEVRLHELGGVGRADVIDADRVPELVHDDVPHHAIAAGRILPVLRGVQHHVAAEAQRSGGVGVERIGEDAEGVVDVACADADVPAEARRVQVVPRRAVVPLLPVVADAHERQPGEIRPAVEAGLDEPDPQGAIAAELGVHQCEQRGVSGVQIARAGAGNAETIRNEAPVHRS